METESWMVVCNDLLSVNSRLMSELLLFLCKSLGADLHSQLVGHVTSDSITQILPLFPSWENVNIEEVGETGESVKSDIKIPGHPTPALIQALTKLCSSVNCIALHTISKAAQADLINYACEQLVTAYSSFDCKKLNQAISLQLIFDLKFLQMSLIPRDNKILTSKVTSLIQTLELQVDPFDLDVFTPHINTRVRLSAHRTQTILGILIPRDRQVLSSKSSSTTSSNNTLPIIPVVDIPRFSNVPLPVSSNNSTRISTLTSTSTHDLDAKLSSSKVFLE